MNVVMIVVDTLRADHLGCYGYERNTSPNLDQFAADSVVFERMIAPGIPTHPAFTTVYTGQHPIHHGVVAHGGHNDVPRTAPWLPKAMMDAGYVTGAADNIAEWSPGFRRGFEYYIDPMQRRVLGLNCDNRAINQRAIPWIQQRGEDPFFLVIHYWDPHTPYIPPRAYRRLFYKGDPSSPEHANLEGMDAHPLGRAWRETWFNKLSKKRITDANYIEALYDAEIRYCDEGIAQVLRALEETGLADDTVVAVLADHGELMYRHGVYFDHHGLYDGNLHVPLLMRVPGVAPRRVAPMVRQYDVAPTILDLCGVDPPAEMDGVSLAPWLRGEREDAVCEFVVSEECTWQMKWGIRTERYKLIVARQEDFYHSPGKELYDLQEDPGEFTNVYEKRPEVAAQLEEKLENWVAARMDEHGLDEDPLVRHGLTLGKRWQESRV